MPLVLVELVKPVVLGLALQPTASLFIFLFFAALAASLFWWQRSWRYSQRLKEQETAFLMAQELASAEALAAREDTANMAEQAVKMAEYVAQMTHQQELLELKNMALTDSLQYAQRIQAALLPFWEDMARAFPDYFVYHRPCQIVSGDFYWFTLLDQTAIIAAVDCTGHGVPGALMTILGNAALEDIVHQRGITHPGTILEELDRMVRKQLKQRQTGNTDGMDAALCTVDLQKRELHFAGAKNPLVYVDMGSHKVIKGSRRTIGGHRLNSKEPFETHTVSLKRPGTFYLYTDGYQDQFGGPKDRKFTSRRFRELLYDIYDKPMENQRKILSRTMYEWMGEGGEQTDDILVIGFNVQ